VTGLRQQTELGGATGLPAAAAAAAAATTTSQS